jgi:prolyl-tRNA editing enzyme YbaK/EbsC (Cys-tRNA(Pro) deacylase)
MLKSSAQRVQEALHALGYQQITVLELPASTRSAAEAAQAIGCQVGQIAKSLVFKTRTSQCPILVIASGVNRVDLRQVSELTREKISQADADFVRQQTGFAIGGIPPVGHSQPLETFIDADLLNHEHIWAAAGTPHAVFQLTPADLVTMTGGHVASIKLDQPSD